MNKPNKELKERPILFSAPMVRAILDGRKTQTRRVVKTKPFKFGGVEPTQNLLFLKDEIAHFGFNDLITNKVKCPYGGCVGDRLWVRESFGITKNNDTVYRADNSDFSHDVRDDAQRWRPSIFMPRAFSRITLEITGIRVERLQDISEADARAEGCLLSERIGDGDWPEFPTSYKDACQYLWESINGEGSWDLNPFVWVIEFERVTP